MFLLPQLNSDGVSLCVRRLLGADSGCLRCLFATLFPCFPICHKLFSAGPRKFSSVFLAVTKRYLDERTRLFSV